MRSENETVSVGHKASEGNSGKPRVDFRTGLEDGSLWKREARGGGRGYAQRGAYETNRRSHYIGGSCTPQFVWSLIMGAADVM